AAFRARVAGPTHEEHVALIVARDLESRSRKKTGCVLRVEPLICCWSNAFSSTRTQPVLEETAPTADVAPAAADPDDSSRCGSGSRRDRSRYPAYSGPVLPAW